jgi:hypothetical protein
MAEQELIIVLAARVLRRRLRAWQRPVQTAAAYGGYREGMPADAW